MNAAQRTLFITLLAMSQPTSTGESALDIGADVEAALHRIGPMIFAADGDALRERFEWSLSDSSFRGMALAAPESADRQLLPVLLAIRQTVRRGWEVGLHAHLKLAIVDAASGSLQVLPAFPTTPGKHPADTSRPPAPQDGSAQAIETSLHRFDLAALARSELPAGRMRITALAADQHSNTVVTTLRGEAVPAQAALPAAATAAGAPASQFRLQVVRAAGRWWIELAGVVPAPKQHRPEIEPLLPVGLLMLDRDQGKATVRNLRVAIDPAPPSGAPATRILRIAIDDIAERRVSDSLWVYVFIGDNLAGPLAIDLP